jgi:subtilase family serine protease
MWRAGGKAVGAALILAWALMSMSASAGARARAEIARVGAAPAAQPLQLVLPLRADLTGLEALARAVNTPGSALYHHYASIAELSRRFGARAQARRLVVSYLRRAGATAVRIDATGLFADATLSAARAQRLFGGSLARFRAAHAASFVAPSAAVRIPRALRGAVTGVVGLDTRPLLGSERPSFRARAAAGQPSSELAHTGTASGCAAGVSAGETGGDPRTAAFTPNQYLTAYGLAALQASGITGQGERVALIEIDGFKSSDLSSFADCFGLHVPPVNAFGVGVKHPLAPGGESTLDLEVLSAAAPGLKGIDVYETSANAANTLRAMTAPLQNHGFHPQVISASLGLCEPALSEAVGPRGLMAAEGALAEAAASGITFLASSGDSGSADCTGPDGLPLRRLSVNYPASSPWVTGVGGTNLELNSANQITGQLVWNDADPRNPGAGGGGTSILFRRPYYQDGTVSQRHRAVPDVSLLADVAPGYAVFCTAWGDCLNRENSQPWESVGGTSAASPLLAGGLALVDEQLRRHERQDLGLVNPLLYEIGRSASLRGQVFSDVLAFGNDIGPYIPGSGRPLGCCSAGAGFDRASGWGSVNLAAFAPVATMLQPPHIALRLPPRQHPLRRRAIEATVSCAAACRIGAFARVSVRGRGSFQVDSGVVSLPGAGQTTLRLPFTRREMRTLWRAFHRHEHAGATVFGATITGRRTIQSQTSGERLRLIR